jgi:high-affinity nickel-transport protein
MSLVDTTDGVMMLGAYGWAYVKPIRKLYYNLNITLVSVLIAFLIGGVEVLSIVAGQLGLRGGLWDLVGNLDFGLIGFGIIAIFVLSWAISTVIYRRKGYDDLPTRPAPSRPRPDAAA